MAHPPDTLRRKKTLRSVILGLAAMFSGSLLAWWWLGPDWSGGEWAAMLFFFTATITIEAVLYFRDRREG